MIVNALKYLLSFILVAFGEPTGLAFLAPIASACGLFICWQSLVFLSSLKRRFAASMCWFAAVQAVQLSWLATPDYHGALIYALHLFIVLWFGCQFGLLSLFLPLGVHESDRCKEVYRFRFTTCLAMAAFWVLLEESRLHLLIGFGWNPLGFALAAHPFSLQAASLVGIYGLSFWVILVNATLYLAFLRKRAAGWLIFVVLAFFPYLFGAGHLFWRGGFSNASHLLSAVIVQPSLYPEEKVLYPDARERFFPGELQWKRCLSAVKMIKGTREKVDLIVFPEAAFPYEGDENLFYRPLVEQWQQGQVLVDSDAGYQLRNLDPYWVSNRYLAKRLADEIGAGVVIGLDEKGDNENESYSAGLYFTPGKKEIERYEKQILIPLVESLPWQWLLHLSKRYGISAFFTPGKEMRVFSGKIPFAVSICIEETYPRLIRQGRVKGANLFINLTNDGWYPKSSLARQHLFHGILRAVENGVPVIRACNIGISAGIDRFGKIIGCLEENPEREDLVADALYVQIPTDTHMTLYALWGDGWFLVLCGLVLTVYSVRMGLHKIRETSYSSNQFSQ